MRLHSIKPVYKNSLAGLIGIICLTLLFFLPLRTVNQIWQGYRVLVVPLEQNEQNILENLEKQGISAVVTESNSQIVNENVKTPSQPALKKWNDERSRWFRNVTDNFRYFYLVETPFLETNTRKAFSGVHYSWYLEHSDGIKLIPVLLSFLLLVFCLFFIKNHIIFLSYSTPIVFYTFFCNTFSGYATSIFTIFIFCKIN